MNKKCALLFSGGTDSTCAAAVLAKEDFREIHLLTFFEEGTKGSPMPLGNAEKLRAHFPHTTWHHRAISTDKIVRHLAYENYFRNLLSHGTFLLAMPGFSTLSWHIAAIAYCKKEGITVVGDGLTRELMHFPGHMDAVIRVFSGLYEAFGIRYVQPVRDWEVPPDRQFLDRLLIDHHLSADTPPTARTTGNYLYRLGIFSEPNVKGTATDRRMQHDCYPFVLFNIFVFWLWLPLLGYKRYERGIVSLFERKTNLALVLLKNHFAAPDNSKLNSILKC